MIPSLARDARKDCQFGPFLERRSTALLLFQRTGMELRAGSLGTGLQHLFEQPGVQRARSHGIDIDRCVAQFVGERFGESDHCRLRRGIGAEAWQRSGRDHRPTG
jgi:hypothetical protein